LLGLVNAFDVVCVKTEPLKIGMGAEGAGGYDKIVPPADQLVGFVNPLLKQLTIDRFNLRAGRSAKM
jgi:hypothetical protein